MNQCPPLISPAGILGSPRDAYCKAMYDANLRPTTISFLATLEHHARESLAYLALSLTTPVQPTALLPTPLFDTF